LYLPADPSVGLTDQQKVEWLERVDREPASWIRESCTSPPASQAVHEVILIATSDGELAGGCAAARAIHVSVLVEQNGGVNRVFGNGWPLLAADLRRWRQAAGVGREAVRQALVNWKRSLRRREP